MPRCRGRDATCAHGCRRRRGVRSVQCWGVGGPDLSRLSFVALSIPADHPPRDATGRPLCGSVWSGSGWTVRALAFY